MSIWEAVALGALQGLTEFLPISSSGHLALIKNIMGLSEVPVFFDLMLHVGTLLAIVFFYRAMLRDLIEKRSYRLLAMLALATLPTLAAGALFRPTKPSESATWHSRIGDMREHAAERPRLVIAFLVCTGGILALSARVFPGSIDVDSMSWSHALLIGIAQAFSAVCPGLSRSGMTVSTALLWGLRPEWAVHFSLLMSLGVIPAAAALKLLDVDPQWLTPANLTATFAGTLVSTLVGWCCILLLLRAVRRGRWWWFSVYLWCFAAAGLLFA